MSVFDLNANTSSSATQATGNTGSVQQQTVYQEGSNTGGQQNTSPENQLSGDGKKIVLDGPLSEIYTKALNAIYSKDTVEQVEEKVGQETQQMDAVLVADIHKLAEKNKKDQMEQAANAAYVYVTDDESLKGNGLTAAFDNVRIALDMKGFDKKVVCIECRNPTTYPKVELLANFARGLNVPVFYTRQAAMGYLKDL